MSVFFKLIAGPASRVAPRDASMTGFQMRVPPLRVVRIRVPAAGKGLPGGWSSSLCGFLYMFRIPSIPRSRGFGLLHRVVQGRAVIHDVSVLFSSLGGGLLWGFGFWF